MNASQTLDPEPIPLEDQLVGINAKTAPYPAARSWSGGRRRILGKGPLEAYCYHVMSRTCGGEVFFDDVEKEKRCQAFSTVLSFNNLLLFRS